MEALRPWFALKSVPGVGNLMFRRLVERFGSPAAVFAAEPDQLTTVQGISARLTKALRAPSLFENADRELEAVRKNGCSIVVFNDPRYPQLLTQIPDPPPLLYVYGTLPQAELTIAVVGSRNATEYGISTTRTLCQDLAGRRVCITSGMARGVDTAAHIGAIAGGGTTVAVLGTGLNRIYPRENRHLFHQIAEHGAVVSELPMDSGPDAHHFPARNRIISGMSHGTLVVEATGRSGSLITARLAAEQNREVFAVPGNIHSFKSVGTHSLIKQGAKLVVHAGDILEEFSLFAERPASVPAINLPPLTDDEVMVIHHLEAEAIHIDELVRQLQLPMAHLSSLLLQLEVKEVVVQQPGKRFCLSPGIDPNAIKKP